MRRYRYRYTVAQLHRYKNSCRYKYFFLRLATLYIIRRHALQQLRRRRRQRQRQRQGQWQRQQMRHVTHSAFYLCADLFNAAFFFFFYFSQLYSSLFCFVLLPCVDSPDSPVSLSRLSHVLFINLAKNAARIRPVAAIFQYNFQSCRAFCASVCDSARCQRKTVWKIVRRDFHSSKKAFSCVRWVYFGAERETQRERVRLPCAPCTLCQSISLSVPLAASLSLCYTYSPSILPLSLSSLSQIYCAQITQKSVSPGQ